MKKCKQCGVPLDGFFSKIARLLGVKQSKKNPDYCNKCENAVPSQVPPPADLEAPAAPVQTVPAETTPVPEPPKPETPPSV